MIYMLAMLAGALLTLNIYFTNTISELTSPVFGSFVTHGVGALASLVVVYLFAPKGAKRKGASGTPSWAYFGGVFGAATLVLFSVILKTGVPLSTVFCLVLTGQVLFSIVSDYFGFFDTPGRKLDRRDFGSALLVLLGSFLLIALKG